MSITCILRINHFTLEQSKGKKEPFWLCGNLHSLCTGLNDCTRTKKRNQPAAFHLEGKTFLVALSVQTLRAWDSYSFFSVSHPYLFSLELKWNGLLYALGMSSPSKKNHCVSVTSGEIHRKVRHRKVVALLELLFFLTQDVFHSSNVPKQTFSFSSCQTKELCYQHHRTGDNCRAL